MKNNFGYIGGLTAVWMRMNTKSNKNPYMLKHTRKSSGGTSFHGSEIHTTAGKLKSLFPHSYEGSNDGRDKTNYDFTLEDAEGNVVTIYDWKEYRPIADDEMIYFHIGGKSETITEKAREYLETVI
jgi:hypothetical protein